MGRLLTKPSTWLLLVGLGMASVVSAKSLDKQIPGVLAGEHRSEANRARDEYRHPAQTLAFFGLTPEQTVVEIWPGGSGWYTEILAPLLRKDGQLYCAHWESASPIGYFARSRRTFDAKVAEWPDVYDQIIMSILEPPGLTELAPAGSVDAVLTFRNVHNWLKMGTAEGVFSAMYTALKPGGIVGVVEHRAKPGTTENQMIESGYVTEARVIWLAKSAGLEFVGRSEINANPADTTDHPKGVWTLPPTLRLGDEGREHYTAIGESDRMTLKFRKPD